MDKIGNYCQDWHPGGGPRTVVTIRNGVETSRTLPPPMPPADRLTTLEAAVRKLVDLVNVYLPPNTMISDREFISAVIGAVDNPDVFWALEKVK